jgi:predicted RNase H-like nuclease (RuvC/YqgF family)
MNNTEKQQMVEVVGEALESAVLPAIYELKEDVKVLKEDVKVLKDDVKVLKEDVKILKEDMIDVKDTLEEHGQRLEKVEYNTRVYPYDKEYVDKTFHAHDARISKLELKCR